ncbi:MAG: cytochrome c [Geminicoccaceae bacterium]|nr:cytochrome c [Geminicoccaceae bacterium]
MRKLVLASLAAASVAAAVGGATLATAQEKEKATGITAYRQSVMDSFGADSKALKTLLIDGEGPVDLAPLHVQYMIDMAPHIPDLFPEGGDNKGSHALPAVWKDREGFKQAADNFKTKAEALLAATEGGDKKEMAMAYAALGKEGCGGCHNDYREKED